MVGCSSFESFGSGVGTSSSVFGLSSFLSFFRDHGIDLPVRFNCRSYIPLARSVSSFM